MVVVVVIMVMVKAMTKGYDEAKFSILCSSRQSSGQYWSTSRLWSWGWWWWLWWCYDGDAQFSINCSWRQSSGRCWSRSRYLLPIGRGWKTNEILPISRLRSTITLHFIQQIHYVANVVDLAPESEYQLIILVHGRACSIDTRRSWHHWQNWPNGVWGIRVS